MTTKNTYWIADAEGVKACVSGAAERDFWTRVHGYLETTPPTGQEFQWVRNVNHGGRGRLNHEAALLLSGLGWQPSDPPPAPGLPEMPVETPAAPPPADTVTTDTGRTAPQ